MGSRKRAKPNPKAEVPGLSKAPETPLPLPETILLPTEPDASQEHHTQTTQAIDVETDKHSDSSSAKPKAGCSDTPRSTKSWYGGTWPKGSKAAPITQIAKESNSSASTIVSGALGSTTSRPSQEQQGSRGPSSIPSLYLSRNLDASSRSLPLSATTTKVNISSNGAGKRSDIHTALQTEEKPPELKPAVDQRLHQDGGFTKTGGDNTETAPNVASGLGQENAQEMQVPMQSSWLGWFAKADGITEAQEQSRVDNDGPSKIIEQIQRRNSEPNSCRIDSEVRPPPRSWLAIWGNTQDSKDSKASLSESPDGSAARPPEVSLNTQASVHGQPQQNTVTSSGWAFWSRGNSDLTPLENPSTSTVGELAVAGSNSQSNPEKAVVDLGSSIPIGTGKSFKRNRHRSLEVSEVTPQRSNSKADASGNLALVAQLPNKPISPKPSSNPTAGPPNLILPSVKGTYRYEDSPGILQKLSRYLYSTNSPAPRHVSLLKDPPRINRALAIGIHGYFPAPLIRSVLGQPTGTSIRFADSAAIAIRNWTEAHGYICEPEKIALEGEGKIEERVDLLWKLLLNWLDEIRKSDFILVACHSQGVPVAMMLVAKLISFGCVNGARIGICAMAGVNLGPFLDYKSRWISGSAGELFDFARPDSQVSKDYAAALELALKFGVKIVYIGSIDDQLVSLESSTFGVIEHPHVYRAVFVDGRVHASDFITHLVEFALKLRNLGVPDHGLIRELSSPLAGSLYGEGHSTIYADPAVYSTSLAVEYALETTTLIQYTFRSNRSVPPISQNPYILPFAMRGVLEEEYVRAELNAEMNELLKQFDAWKPTSKVLKDVKFRLEGVRSKL